MPRDVRLVLRSLQVIDIPHIVWYGAIIGDRGKVYVYTWGAFAPLAISAWDVAKVRIGHLPNDTEILMEFADLASVPSQDFPLLPHVALSDN